MTGTMAGLERDIVDHDAHRRNLAHMRDLGLELPLIAELADPPTHLATKAEAIADVAPDAADGRNLYRVHWHNGADRRGLAAIPEHLLLTKELTGVKATIVMALGDRFPMIGAHKVLAAYGCLVPRLVSGAFDITRHRAVWPSTGNYCRGGVAIARLLKCRSVAVLPEGMSRERFNWLESWVVDPADIHPTPGSESNVKEIYDACRELSRDPQNIILNQFAEFGNYVIHRAVTGPALERLFRACNGDGRARARAFVAASGSAGTLAAGDYLKDALGTQTAVVESRECPTLLYNGYGEHNIQGIGDKHVPLIHNVMDTDFVIGVSDAATDALHLVFNTDAGRDYLCRHRGLDPRLVAALAGLGLSGIANLLASIKYAKYMDLGPDDVLLSVATDGAAMYGSETLRAQEKYFNGGFSEISAAESFGRYMLGCETDHMLELDRYQRERIFNLGYYTWVEQQNIDLADFERRRERRFWDGLMELAPVWDGMIAEMNSHLKPHPA